MKVDLFDLGREALEKKRSLHGDRVYFARTFHINPTNICLNACPICAFSRRSRKDAGAWEYSVEEARRLAREGAAAGARQFHIVGGLHPAWPFERYIEIIREIRNDNPGIGIKGYTAVEVSHLAEISGRRIEEVLEALSRAGLDKLAGGGAEIFSSRARRIISPEKISGEEWLAVHKAAHRMGIRSNATMLIGHIETFRERIAHLDLLEALQEETGGFDSFILLVYHPGGTELGGNGTRSASDILRTMATARVILDGFPHIRAYWVHLGLKLTSLALDWGADEVGGTVGSEAITHMAGSKTPAGLGPADLVSLIEGAGKIPVEVESL